jgi:hypothetical protein
MPDLPQLSQIEEMLIAQVQPLVSVFVVRGGQLSYRGNIINFPQNVQAFLDTLPRDPSTLDVLVVRQLSRDGSAAFRDYKVNRQNVAAWLHWLKANNQFYQHINIDEEALQRLPENGSVYDRLRQVSDAGVSASVGGDDSPLNDDANDLLQDNLEISFVPAPPPERPEVEAINAEMDRLENEEQPAEWPRMSDTPINEFSEVGYMARAFPTLYPWGKADLRDARQRGIQPADYFTHLLK